jgi:ferredoxin
VIAFRRLGGAGGGELALDARTRYPPKALIMPQSEAMFHVQGAEFEPVNVDIPPQIVLGLRACDARAIQLLDDVFISPENPDPYWISRREQTTLVVIGCAKPRKTCFCTTVGSGPFDSRGADVLLIESGDGYIADVRTEKGERLFDHLPDATSEQVAASQQTQDDITSRIAPAFETADLVAQLYSLFETDFWYDVQQSCLGCGVCTYLCPTCHCFDIEDEVQRSERVRNWDSCMFRIYSQEASGHNPRPTNAERTRQRIMHKYAYFIESFDEIGCTGCGRCVRYCPVDLDIRDIIRSAQSRAAT